jgi:hypothetical protein
MWNRQLEILKQFLDLVVVLIAVISALVGYASSLSEFLRGFAVGAFVAALPLIAIRLFGILRPELGIAAAEKLATEYENKRETIQGVVSVSDVELKEKRWHVSGSWFPASIVVTVGGPPKFGDPNLGKDFEVVIDSRSSKVVKYSAKFREAPKPSTSDER